MKKSRKQWIWPCIFIVFLIALILFGWWKKQTEPFVHPDMIWYQPETQVS